MPIKKLATHTTTGGVLGDTINADVIVRVFSDGVYGVVPRDSVGDLYESVADKASRPTAESQADGYTVKVLTNGLAYVVQDSVYAILDYQITVADLVARDALTEVETGQRVAIDALDRVDRWDGAAWVEGESPDVIYDSYADLPDPTTYKVGTKARVVNDTNTALNGSHIATGSALGTNAKYWDAA